MGQQEIVKLLEKHNKWMDAEEIRKKLGINNISAPLKRLRNTASDVYWKSVQHKGNGKKYVYIAKKWL